MEESHLRESSVEFKCEWLVIYKRGNTYAQCLKVLDGDMVSKSLGGLGSLVWCSFDSPTVVIEEKIRNSFT